MSHGLAKQIRIGLHRNLIRFGIDIRKKRADRKILEQVVFAELLRDSSMQRILFVGCAWYTLHYPRIFKDREFTTMELCPTESRYGASRHICDTCENIAEHFDEGSLDAVIFNGVYGFGLNTMDALQRTHQGIHRALRPQGLLVYGWNDTPDRAPFPFNQLRGIELFRPYTFPSLGKSIVESDAKNRHRFHFFTAA
jgi:hypothetical protein